VTATTVIGFLSNLTSPVPPIQEFGVVSSVGIVAALAVFGVLIPALKVEIDDVLEARGFDREKRAFGTGGGRFSSLLAVGSTAARKAPVVVLVLTLVVTSAGAYGATQVDTSFSQEDFLAEEPPDWMHDLPEPFAPGEYSAAQNLEYVNENFVREDSQAQILIEGDVTGDNTLEGVQRARDVAAEQNVTQTLSNDQPLIQGPLSTMQQVAATNESFNATFTAADTDGDGVPDQNLEGVYDHLFEVAPDQAQSYVHQTEDGDYEALRMVVSIDGGASGDDITTEMRAVADELDGDGLETTATGSAILNKIVQDQLLETVVQSLIITLVAVFAFLMVTYRFTDGSATLGAVTLLPVVLSVAWILGTMYLLGIPFNVLTGMITSLTVGLGVAYSIHLSERYMQELERHDSVWAAMRTAVTGTGGALLGSAATTVGGFGVLVFAILPPLQQFGVITGLTIIYAFLASVLVLPTLLVVWTKYLGPEWTRSDFQTDAAATPVTEGDESDWEWVGDQGDE
jgi:predicted RND superfamily exporter protein